MVCVRFQQLRWSEVVVYSTSVDAFLDLVSHLQVVWMGKEVAGGGIAIVLQLVCALTEVLVVISARIRVKAINLFISTGRE